MPSVLCFRRQREKREATPVFAGRWPFSRCSKGKKADGECPLSAGREPRRWANKRNRARRSSYIGRLRFQLPGPYPEGSGHKAASGLPPGPARGRTSPGKAICRLGEGQRERARQQLFSCGSIRGREATAAANTKGWSPKAPPAGKGSRHRWTLGRLRWPEIAGEAAREGMRYEKRKGRRKKDRGWLHCG